MKYLFAFIIIPLLYADIAFGFGEHPEAFCIKKHQDTDFDCIVHCKLKHYTFADDSYIIKEHHIKNLADFLIRYNVVSASRRKDVVAHLKSCVKQSIKKAKIPSCDSSFRYYTCITDEKLIHFNAYDSAIRRYDQTLNVVTSSKRI
uniref:14.6 kDa salivary protein n=1 Tax=Phlebotomus duboscqi TaxID=37738 RepID=Q06K75_PHLDU|nr:14.6 kDa salivary protein [Phlebotomus duboscqi]